MRALSRPGAGVLVAIALAASAGCRSEPQPVRGSQVEPAARPPSAVSQPPAAAPQPSAVPRGYAGPLPALPQVPYPPARPPDVVRVVYAFAARNPDVLHYVPCFCGCEHHGHQGSDDCFVAARDASGKPTWEMHGYV